MSQRECARCARPVADGAPLCRTCLGVLRDDLRSVPDLLDDLLVTISRQDRLGAGRAGGRGGEQPAPRLAVTQALDELVAAVTSWANTLSLAHGAPITWPARVGQDTALHHAAVAADWLADHIDQLRTHPAAVRAHRELTAVITAARRRADRPDDRTRVPVGPCPEHDTDGTPCPGEVWAHVPTDERRQAAELRCRCCGARWDTTQWYRAGRRIAARRDEQLRETDR